MWLPPHLKWRQWRLRNREVPRRGRPLSEVELVELDRAWFALIDEDGTRRVAADEKDMAVLAAQVLAGDRDEDQ